MSGAIGYEINASTSGTGPWTGRAKQHPGALRPIRTWSAPCGPGGPTRPEQQAFRRTSCCTTPRMAALASLRPRNTEELLLVPGLGPVKASRYGPTLLALLCNQVAAG